MDKIKKWHRAELLIFTIVTIANLLPFISTRFFPSMDGASHLANSNIINQLVINHNSLFQQFFMINPEPVPNWTSHLLISLLTLVMPAFLAEKILIILLLAGIPFAFRDLIHKIAPNRMIFSFLVFPFTHSMFFFFGFFNFCIAILLFLITLTYWLKHEGYQLQVKQVIILTLLIALTYFSHIVIFGTLLIAIAFHLVTGTIMSLLHKTKEFRHILVQLLQKSLVVLISSVIPLLLFIYFFYSRPGTREITYISKPELLNFLISVRPLISLNPVMEGKYTTILAYLLIAVVIAGIIGFTIRAARKIMHKTASVEEREQLLPGFHFWWLLSTMFFLLLLYFYLPDAYGTASYTNLRIGFVFFLLAIAWLSTFRIAWYLGLLAAIAGLYVNTMLIRYYAPNIRDLGKLAAECNKASEKITPNSLVLPIYCLDNWFTGHFVDYLAVDKPVVMVYNYECQSGYFPVIWNEKMKPNYYLGNASTPEKYINFELVKGRPSLMLDYVFVVGQYDPAKDWFFGTLHKILTEDFTKVYEAEHCSLYRNKATSVIQ